MLQFLPVQENNLFAIRATGRLGPDDYEAFLPELENRTQEFDKVSVLIELDDFHGWTLDAAREDWQSGTQFNDKFERIALVGEKLWQRWMTIMSKPFINGEVQYFSRDEISNAWDWLRASQINPDPAGFEPAPYQRLIAAVDFSPHSLVAVKRAIELSKLYKAELTLLHVINEEYLYDILYGPGDIGFAGYDAFKDATANEEVLREQADKRMADLLESLDTEGLNQEIVVGTPSHAILSMAEAKNADLIVMGTHGRRGLARLLGSNARSVVTKARCEVLTIRLPSLDHAD